MLSLSVLAVAAAGQEPEPAEPPVASPAPRDPAALRGISLRYPRDKDSEVARVDGRPIPFEEVAEHIERRHWSGFREFLATPAGNLFFKQRPPADWVRLYADVVALAAEARARGKSASDAEATLSASLKRSFDIWLRGYLETRELEGRPLPVTEERVAMLLERFQRDNGLAVERQGWVEFLTPAADELGDEMLYRFYQDYPRYFGGLIHLSHILVYNRHPVSGQLLVADDRPSTDAMVAEIASRLRPDGSNFEDVARLLSEDRATGAQGGVFKNVQRFGSSLPPEVVRAAWSLTDGAFTGPIASSYGLHFVKRLSFVQRSFFLFTPATSDTVREVMLQKLREDLLLEVRARHRVALAY